MIHISDIVNKIKVFLEIKGEERFKIFVRINFNIDVYVLTPNIAIAKDYQKEFIDSLCSSTSDDTIIDDYYKSHSQFLRINFNIVNLDDADGDPFYANMFNTQDGVIDWGPRYRFDSFLRNGIAKNTKRASAPKAPIVTFYSYKGGMGRTTTMVAYAMSLAANKDVTKRKQVVIIDCDLEAPGYLNFFDLSEHNGLKSGKKNGFVEFICDAQLTVNSSDLDINDYIINVGLDNKNSFAYNNLDNIWLVPAGNLNEGYADLESNSDRNDYLEGLAKINLSSIPSVIKYFNLLFDKINETIHPDIILIDSRTGFNDIFGTTALYLSSYVVGFFGFSRQTQPGLINLLKEYYKPTNKFKLQLVFSILPENATEEWINYHKQQILEYVNFISSEDKDYPSFLYLHRNSLLEQIGTGDNQSDASFVDLVKERKFDDYNALFDEINNHFFMKKESESFNSNTPALTLRNVVLKQLKNALANVSNFAEDTQIKEEQFFYRECMKELFDPKKFLIQGYKGTGKTYLYKALADKDIAANIQKWAGLKDSNMLDSIFINILPTNETALVFENIRYSGIDEPEYFFNIFWQIYSWNVLLLHPEFEEIRKSSELVDYIKPLEGTGYAKEALIRIEELVNIGVKASVAIEKDIVRINSYLTQKRKRLFVLYDRLDTCINPLRWNKAVSPLINYWRNNCESFSNIAPKIFVRTDLFKQIEGTNTARLENNIIHIEWSIEEVFGYFFKLIFSSKLSSDAFWAIAEKIKIDSNYIKEIKDSFLLFPENQIKPLNKKMMMRLIYTFFGYKVDVGTANLGSPWDYFSKELANADHTAISLRPFINMLDGNAVDIALSRTEKYVKNGIISPDIYASKAVRDDTTEKYFSDLARDAFSKDLLRLKEIISSSGGEKYRFKSLSEDLFEDLIETTFGRIHDSAVVKSQDDLKRLIFANGIMSEKITTKGRFFRFAPIYWYSWGLVNSVLENEEKRNPKGYVEVGEFEGVVVDVGNTKKIKCSQIDCLIKIKGANKHSFIEGDVVIFKAKRKNNELQPGKTIWSASNVRLKE